MKTMKNLMMAMMVVAMMVGVAMAAPKAEKKAKPAVKDSSTIPEKGSAEEINAAKAKKAKVKRRLPITPVKDVQGLPRVLIIGDSISIGYTMPTQDLLKGKVNVHRIPTNGGPTTLGLKVLTKWLGKGKWDVIHFNWGLHDLKYINTKGGLTAVATGKQQVSLADYEANLVKLVTRMKKTGAKLIFATTTPVPEGAKGRVVGDDVKYNAVALKVMKAEGVAVDDLYTFIKPTLATAQREANVHFFPDGSKAMARQVANHILKALGKKPLPAPKAALAPAKEKPAKAKPAETKPAPAQAAKK